MIDRRTQWGTNHFASTYDAECYYRKLGFNNEDVKKKIKTQEISIGKPKLKKNQIARLDKDLRYQIIKSK